MDGEPAHTQGFTTASLRLIRSSGAIVRHNTFAGGNSGIIVTQQSTNVTVDANIVRDVLTSPLGGGNGIDITVSSSVEVHNNNIENNPSSVYTSQAAQPTPQITGGGLPMARPAQAAAAAQFQQASASRPF